MNTDVEDLLRDGLRDAPGPPAEIDVASVLRRAAQRRRLMAAAVAVVAVLGLAASITATVAASRGRASPPADTRLSAIQDVLWRDTASTGTVVFHDGTMRLFDGCSNQLFRMRVAGSRLVRGKELGPAGICSGLPLPNSVLRAAQRRVDHFWTVLSGPATWQRAGNSLTLTTRGAGSVRLVTNGQLAPELVGTTWALVSFGSASSDIPYSGPARLRFPDRTSFATSGVCPPSGGSAIVGVTAVRFRPEPDAGVSCAAKSPMEPAASNAVTAALRGSVRYQIRGNELMLDAGRRGFLVFRAVGR